MFSHLSSLFSPVYALSARIASVRGVLTDGVRSAIIKARREKEGTV
jgi:hypothetical protein